MQSSPAYQLTSCRSQQFSFNRWVETAVKSTRLLMKHGNSNYPEVLTAQQTLLEAELSQAVDRFDEIQGVINLYHALGGGVN